MERALQIPDLLEQLALNRQTTILAKVTQRMIAALKIPMQARQSSDHSLGGVSDITNRGNFDRLLLSELAHDDLSLMVRLANNEALYLRREELPSKNNRQRFILVDNSIKMWGAPRLYAIAAALACSRNNKAEIIAISLQGNTYNEIELSSIAGVQEALTELSPAINSAGGLTAFTKEHVLTNGQEYVLITDEHLFYTPAFQMAFAHLRNAYGFLITVSRSGQVQLFKYAAGSRRLLSNVVIEMPVLEAVNTKTINTIEGMPVFLSKNPAPLRFPASMLVIKGTDMFIGLGLTNITQDQRLLYWPDKETGAIEILPFITPAKYYFGHDGISKIYILLHIISTPGIFKIYTIDIDSFAVTTRDITHRLSPQEEYRITFNDVQFFIQTPESMLAINPANGMTSIINQGSSQKIIRPASVFIPEELKHHIDNTHNIVSNIKRIYIDTTGNLALDQRVILINGDNFMTLNKSTATRMDNLAIAVAQNSKSISLPGVRYKLKKFEWKNGCAVFVDSRGFLHLRSIDKNIPEVTISLVINTHLACWASDGTVCGNKYFTGPHHPNRMHVQAFYEKYIQSFIDVLRK